MEWKKRKQKEKKEKDKAQSAKRNAKRLISGPFAILLFFFISYKLFFLAFYLDESCEKIKNTQQQQIRTALGFMIIFIHFFHCCLHIHR